MVAALRRADVDVTVWNRTSSMAEKVAGATGAQTAGTPAKGRGGSRRRREQPRRRRCRPGDQCGRPGSRLRIAGRSRRVRDEHDHASDRPGASPSDRGARRSSRGRARLGQRVVCRSWRADADGRWGGTTEDIVEIGAEVGLILLLFMLVLEYTARELRPRPRRSMSSSTSRPE